MPVHIGADRLKKPHHIITLRFSEVVKDHPNYAPTLICCGIEIYLIKKCIDLDLAVDITLKKITYLVRYLLHNMQIV